MEQKMEPPPSCSDGTSPRLSESPRSNNNNNSHIRENSTFESFSEEESICPPSLTGSNYQNSSSPPPPRHHPSTGKEVELCETIAMTSTSTSKQHNSSNSPVAHGSTGSSTSIFRRSLTGELEEKGPAADINNNSNSSSSLTAVGGNHQRRTTAAAGAAAAVEENVWLQVYHISLYSIVGMAIRVYLERLFGLDCTSGDLAVQDVFTPLFQQICVTTNGFTSQTGGALFIDLPANMLGCFIIGLVSNSARPHHPIPWLPASHALQKNSPYLLGLRVGLCGCLTTFASWNTQMVVMLDGTGTVLGPQIVAALFGYLIGLCSAISAFLFGQHVAEWFYNMHEQRHRQGSRSSNRLHLSRRRRRQQRRDQQQPPELHDVISPTNTHDEEDQLSQQDHNDNKGSSRERLSTCCDLYRRFKDCMCGAEGVLAPVLVSGLCAAFVVGDLVYKIPFYREMWMAAIMSPPGALLRWQLYKLFNHKAWPCGCRNRTRKIVGCRHSGSVNSDDDDAVAAAAAAMPLSSASRLGISVRRVSESVMNMPVAFVDWMPWGTFVANILAVIVSAASKALLHLHFDAESQHPWANNILWAIATGFAGNLSTVSTMVAEIVAMKKPSQMHIYAFGSLGVAMVVGLAVYSPIARMP